jgi:DNA replication licensing factor MCM5
VNRLAVVPGIIINSSRTRPKAVSIALRCRNCKGEKVLPVPAGFGGAAIPRVCSSSGGAGAGGEGLGLAGGGAGASERCPMDPYDIEADKCAYVDQQVRALCCAPALPAPRRAAPRRARRARFRPRARGRAAALALALARPPARRRR